ncbi:1,2-phenylacetyl-CoA epoxidase subunit PaaC [Truepera radiovictrix]|uniref:Phenylacetate-CoA oxygenase, PaaI subunit n=1 Tax=Truepera radiovictrix (strain DSM 17093 / CIP 108686 / LMG 22925 / RQ-24) TaxID=649638 RepID=D7CW09_TRURR|nr:1,2-phenylacetyl-CoA epoxidase subunit PaaC [Truepera radiovictrix]ADI14272.1 phenylacetate-CoA oxygenase, PaaI subunit [Truepera radiovictrix DSM 17093]WMT57170.1 1,2-phenylacetyl-CoA epoxidase subunit PaaC [Truepera radiovictrix]
MDDALKTALIAKLTALADDELVLAHRNAEWTGHAPILEEDIALANLAQDELGHATLWYELRAALDGSDPDRVVYFRDASAYRNVPLVELPKGDWALTMLRQFLFDAYEWVLLERLEGSAYAPIAEASAKMRREERFHLQHARAWVERLGLGTEESHRRMQEALGVLWPHTEALFTPLAGDAQLVAAGFAPDVSVLKTPWLALVEPHLKASGLRVPGFQRTPYGRTRHTEHLEALLEELQAVARLEPDTAIW